MSFLPLQKPLSSIKTKKALFLLYFYFGQKYSIRMIKRIKYPALFAASLLLLMGCAEGAIESNKGSSYDLKDSVTKKQVRPDPMISNHGGEDPAGK